MNKENLAWTEKYRPSTVKNVVGDTKNKILNYLENISSMQSLLFYSKTPGTGKTTLAKAIINDLDCDALVLNSSDDRKIEVIREKVKDFARSQSSDGKRKCCFMDESDGMLKATQEALRNLMETYSSNIFFILTCNNINKIHDAIKSRCILIEFSNPEKQDIYTYLEGICKNENLDYSEKGLNKIIDMNYPSIRDCVKILQDMSVLGKKIIENNICVSDDEFKQLWLQIKEKKFSEVQKYIIKNKVDCAEFNKWIFYNGVREDMEIISRVNIIEILAENEKYMNQGADPIIIFLGGITKLFR